MIKHLFGLKSFERALFGEHPIPMWVCDPVTLRFLDVNDAAADLYGYSREELLLRTVDRMGPLENICSPRLEYGVTTATHLRKDGSAIRVQLHTAPVAYQGVPAVLATAYDVTRFLEAEERLARSEQALALAQDTAHLGVFSHDRRTGERRWSEQVYRILGLQPGVAVAVEGFWPFTEREDAQRVRTEVLRARSERRPYRIDHRIVRPDGSTCDVHERGQWHYDASGEWDFHFGTIQDITDRAQAEAEIRYLAFHDPLTKLLNRTGVINRLESVLASSPRQELVAVLCLDINRFKIINDTLGHATGDAVLSAVAQRLQSRLQEGELLARLGGDEFAVVLPGMHHPSQIARRTHHVLQAFQTPYTIASYPYAVSASAGVSVFPSDASDSDELLRNADVAMYAAKSKSPGGFQYYNAGLREAAERRFNLERGLRHALQCGEFAMRYQPLVDAESGAVVAAEALIRWERADRTMTFPDDFIPFAERTNLIHEIGDWVFNNVFAQVQRWWNAGAAVRTWLNVSAAQLDPKLPAKLQALLNEYRLDVDCIGLELTETAFIERGDDVLQILRDIKAMGIRLALDDFGVKYSSLDYLQRLPIDVLKIDRIFVSGVHENPVNRAIVQAILTVARELNFEVSAEGIETQQEMEALTSLGCDTLQGYFFSGALSAEELTPLLSCTRS